MGSIKTHEEIKLSVGETHVHDKKIKPEST